MANAINDVKNKKLNPRQTRFVEFYCSGMSAVNAYQKAGYEGDPQKNAWEIQENPVIRQAIDTKLENFIKSVADKIKQATEEAFEKQLSLMRGAENEFVQLNASKEILDRGGLKSSENIKAEVTNTNINAIIDDKPKTEDEQIRIIERIGKLQKAITDSER